VVIRHRDRSDGRNSRRTLARLVSLAAIGLLALAFGASAAGASTQSSMYSSHTSFAFLSPHIAGAPTGSVAMVGFGSYDTTAGTLHANGLFRCTDTVAQGPLSGCMSGQGTRWSSNGLNATQRFVCGTDAAKTVTTDARTVAFKADFFRYGDTVTPSFSANVIVSAHDIAPDVPGVQNTWIQGVGCGSALQFFHS
jgi:hypothetical protein